METFSRIRQLQVADLHRQELDDAALAKTLSEDGIDCHHEDETVARQLALTEQLELDQQFAWKLWCDEKREGGAHHEILSTPDSATRSSQQHMLRNDQTYLKSSMKSMSQGRSSTKDSRDSVTQVIARSAFHESLRQSKLREDAQNDAMKERQQAKQRALRKKGLSRVDQDAVSAARLARFQPGPPAASAIKMRVPGPTLAERRAAAKAAEDKTIDDYKMRQREAESRCPLRPFFSPCISSRVPCQSPVSPPASRVD